jgi:hypothetical protein
MMVSFTKGGWAIGAEQIHMAAFAWDALPKKGRDIHSAQPCLIVSYRLYDSLLVYVYG